jgi:hypothetical protein
MTKSSYLIIILFLFTAPSLTAQIEKPKKKKGQLYFTWGYNKDWYSKSDLHFKSNNNDYDFTVNDVTAHDKPHFDKIFNSSISIPQFIYRLGYTFANRPKMGIEISFDHAKYIMTQDQVAHVEGKIYENYVDNDTVLTSQFLRFEHTNGANFLMLSFIYKELLLQNKSGKSELYTMIKPGAGIVVPQSEVALFNVDQNNDYHIAGYVMGIDLELRYEYKRHLFLETGFKGVFANYLDVLSVGDSRANHHFFCLEWLIGIGYQIAI